MAELEEDDDWFEKDLEEFVVEKKVEEQEVENINYGFGSFRNAQLDRDGGNYFDPYDDRKFSDQNKLKKKMAKHPNDFFQKIPYKKLSTMADQKNLEIFTEICVHKYEFIETLRGESLGDDLMLIVMKIINKICALPFYEIKNMFLSILKTEQNFWQQIFKFFKKSTQNNDNKKKRKNKIKLGVNLEDFYRNFIDLMKNIKFYSKLEDYYHKQLLANLQEILKDSSLDVSQLQQVVFEENLEDESEQIQIYPKIEDFNYDNLSSNLKKNIVKGKYSSLSEYLGIHLSLLREDFISPLRDGVKEYKEYCKLSSGKPFWNDNIRVHGSVKLLLQDMISRRSQKDELVMVDLDPDDRLSGKSMMFQKTSWNQSKRFMYGSLLCFTSSIELNDLIVAVVCGRENEQLCNGYIFIEIIQMTNFTKIFDKNLIMFESEIFFEPYHHVFNVLKGLDEMTFPFKSYIVDADNTPRFPDYVATEKKLLYNYKNHLFDVKKMGDWKTESSMYPSQFLAFKLALSTKFSLIQGPPGTGKTFLGLEIAGTILENTDNQILVICLTNHALDQFLSGIIKYTDSIVRMGSQSKHDKLDEFNIKQLNEDLVIDKRIRSAYFNTKKEYIKLIEEFGTLTDQGEILEIQRKLRSVSKRINEINQLSTYESIKTKRIIGMTTTFAARNHTLLQLLQIPVDAYLTRPIYQICGKNNQFIIEEAAEILESHIIAALTVSTQHIILIGDHFQLRPTTSVYNLCTEYKMDISLFERMINNDMSYVTLTVQHRMRPEIANLIRPSIYTDLVDSETVKTKPNILGLNKNLFFLTHSVTEDKSDDRKSKRNSFECEYLISLCNYLIHQGYEAKDIVILTTYNGQMFQLMQERRKYPDIVNVRISVVDNFQGEEANIVLLSLVRSNNESSIGFMSFRNRICVALSRAKAGLFIVGNMTLLASCSKYWAEIKITLEAQAAIGCELELKCHQHLNVHSKVKEPYDFDGGCKQACGYIAKCGHICSLQCHSGCYPHERCSCVK